MVSSDALKAVSTEELAAELVARRESSLIEAAGSPKYPCNEEDWDLPLVRPAFHASDPLGCGRACACLRAGPAPPSSQHPPRSGSGNNSLLSDSGVRLLCCRR